MTLRHRAHARHLEGQESADDIDALSSGDTRQLQPQGRTSRIQCCAPARMASHGLPGGGVQERSSSLIASTVQGLTTTLTYTFSEQQRTGVAVNQ